MGRLHVAVHEENTPAGGGGKLPGDEKTVGIAAASERKIERRRVGRQPERVVQANGKRRETIGRGEGDDDDTADRGGVDIGERAAGGWESEVEDGDAGRGDAAEGEAG